MAALCEHRALCECEEKKPLQKTALSIPGDTARIRIPVVRDFLVCSQRHERDDACRETLGHIYLSDIQDNDPRSKYPDSSSESTEQHSGESYVDLGFFDYLSEITSFIDSWTF